MRSRGLRAGAVCVLAALLVAAPAAAAPELSMSRAVVSTRIGADFRFQTTIANPGPAPRTTA